MQVLTPLNLVTPDQLALPSSGTIQVGHAENGKYFGEGWYRVEDIGGVLARWTQQVAVMRVALPPIDTTLTLEAAPYPLVQSVEIVVNGQSVGSLQFAGTWQPVTIKIPASFLVGNAISTIQFKHAHAGTPADSNRILAAAYRTLTFTQSR